MSDILREPPKNINAERTVLGSMLIDRDCCHIVFDELTEDHFYPTAHRIIFSKIRKHYQEGLPIDFIAIVEGIEREGNLKGTGGRSYIAGLEQDVLTTQSVDYYCGLVRQAWFARATIMVCHELIELSHDPSIEPNQISDLAESRFGGLYRQAYKMTAVRPAPDIAKKSMINLSMRLNEELTGDILRTGYRDLDDLLAGGFRTGEFIVLSGVTGYGKTALAHNLANRWSLENDIRGLAFSLEMKDEELFQRHISLITGLNCNMKVRSARLNAEELAAVNAAAEKFARMPLHIDDSSSIKYKQLEARIKRHKAEYRDLKYCIIDYVGLVNHEDFGRDDKMAETEEISKSLKRLAGEVEVVMIALAQFNRNADKRTNKTPVIGDIRYGTTIEQDANIILFVHHDGQNSNTSFYPVKVIVAKQRQGDTATIELKFTPICMRFEDYNTNSEPNW